MADMPPIEQEIMDAIQHLDDADKLRVLEYAKRAAHQTSPHTVPHTVPHTARDLLALPLADRSRLVAESITSAAHEDFEIFEAYSEENPDA